MNKDTAMQEQQPKRPVSELKPAELRTIVGEIQKLLWQTEMADDRQRSRGGCSYFWDADKEWECADLLSDIATVLEDHGLKPVDPPTVTGFKSTDEFTQHIAENLSAPEQPTPDYYGDDGDKDDEIQPS